MKLAGTVILSTILFLCWLKINGKKWSLLVSSFLFPCFLFSDGIMTATVLMCLFWSDHPPNAEYFSGKTDYCYAVLIRFSDILSISTPSPLPPPLTIAPLESVVVNRRQFQKASLLINHTHSNKSPFSNKHPCSVSVIALPECLYTEMHRGSSSFNCSLKASR